MLRKLSIILTSLLFIFPFSATTTHAANFTPSEANQVKQLQQEYAALDKTPFNEDNLYVTKPQLNRKFKQGVLTPTYLSDQLAYINYYRGLFGLTPIAEAKQDSIDAQKTAAVLATLNANPLINQHNLPYEKRPRNVSKAIWQIARSTSNSANLNFNTHDQTAGDVITDLITDRYNLSGPDTGHRAWLLSTRLTTTGIGAAYGKNGYRYSVQKVLNSADVFRKPSQQQVTYPSSGVFPLELVQGQNIAWSFYSSDQVIKEIPQITITDEDTQTTYQAQEVHNYHNSGYGNFTTIITYSPGATPLVNGHEYRVDIAGILSYHFKLFRLGSN